MSMQISSPLTTSFWVGVGVGGDAVSWSKIGHLDKLGCL
jgi:hypothetical protein